MRPETARPSPPAGDESDRAIIAEAQHASANRSLAVGLSGTCLGLLTFFLFFLYNRYVTGEINALLFQATVVAIVVGLFLFAYSAVYCYRVMGAMIRSSPKVKDYLFLANLSFFFGSVALTLETPLILHTVRVNEVATLALGLWVGFIALLVMSRRDFA